MKNFLAAFIVSFILLFICISLFQGLSLFIVPALLIAGALALYLELSKRIARIEQHLGLAPEEPEEAMTITERWEKEREAKEKTEN